MPGRSIRFGGSSQYSSNNGCHKKKRQPSTWAPLRALQKLEASSDSTCTSCTEISRYRRYWYVFMLRFTQKGLRSLELWSGMTSYGFNRSNNIKQQSHFIASPGLKQVLTWPWTKQEIFIEAWTFRDILRPKCPISTGSSEVVGRHCWIPVLESAHPLRLRFCTSRLKHVEMYSKN